MLPGRESEMNIIDRLRIEAKREPSEPIWSDAINEIYELRAAGSSIWDGVTDLLTQEQIEKMEQLYRRELALLLYS